MKKLLTLVLALAMMATMVTIPAMADEEPIKINVINASSGTPSADESYKAVQDWILENTGVYVNSINLDGTNDTEKKNLLLTGDETIHVWWGDWMQYAEYGMIQPINDYLDEIPNTLATWENYGGLMTCTDSEGTVWGLPRNANRVFYRCFIRQDIMDQLGYTEETYPRTFEAFEKFLYEVKAADPYGNGESIVLITRNNMDSLEYQYLGGFTKYGRSNWLDEADGLIKPFYLQPGYYDFLAKMHQWYEDGIIHKENPTWDTNTVRQYIASGRVMASGAYGTDAGNQEINLRANVPGANLWCPVDGLDGLNGEKCETAIKAESGSILFNAKCTPEEIRAFLKVLEFLFSDWGNNYTSQVGMQGIYWEYDVENYGEEAKTLHIVKSLNDGTLPNYNKSFWFSIGLPTEADCVMYDPDGEQNMQNEYIRRQGDVHAAKLQFDVGMNYNNQELYENVMTANDIETMVKEEIMKFFKGDRELTPENWQAFIQELYGAGMQEYCEELTRQYNRAFGIE